MRWRLDLAYDGTGFAGWAVQPGLRTVQGVLEEAIPRVLRLTEPVTLTVAGRTDAGVHARGQVAHVDLPADADPLNDRAPHVDRSDETAASDATDPTGAQLTRRLRRLLDPDLVVRAISPAPEGFDARFSAVWRRYVYRLADNDVVPDPLARGMVAGVRDRLDIDSMNAAAPTLVGLRDFAPFCRRREGATTVRTLLDLHAVRTDQLIEIEVRADAFCHSMVRSLVGALVAVGSGRRDGAWLAEIAGSPTRPSTVAVMAAHGLTLEEVGYPPDDQLAARAIEARQRRDGAAPRRTGRSAAAESAQRTDTTEAEARQ